MMKVRSFLSLLAAIALGLAPLAPLPVNAAASLQVVHQFMCAPEPSVGQSGPRRVVNTSSTASPQPAYVLNGAGCALIANADVGFFLSQGYTNGPNEFVIQQVAVTANQTSTSSTLNLPAYGFIKWIAIEETAGNAVTGGVDCGDAGSATRYLSATAVGANSNVVVTPANTNAVSTGIPVADQILCIAHTGFNSASLNISVIYGYY